MVVHVYHFVKESLACELGICARNVLDHFINKTYKLVIFFTMEKVPVEVTKCNVTYQFSHKIILYTIKYQVKLFVCATTPYTNDTPCFVHTCFPVFFALLEHGFRE